jgi:hypothetical protein
MLKVPEDAGQKESSQGTKRHPKGGIQAVSFIDAKQGVG